VKKNKKFNKKSLIIIGAILCLGIGLIFVFMNNKEQVTLSCEEINEDENAKLVNNIIIEKKNNNIYVNYTGKIEFLKDNEMAYKVMSAYVKSQVSKLNEVDEKIAIFEESKNEINFVFDFDIDLVGEEKTNELLGIYSHDMEELKNHFESGGATCVEI